MELLYGRNITIHMAYEIRDTLLSLASKSSSTTDKTRDWLTKTFGSDEGMVVSVHSPMFCALKLPTD
jgi:hypothetical protein